MAGPQRWGNSTVITGFSGQSFFGGYIGLLQQLQQIRNAEDNLSLQERTREIGIRRALGAKRQHIIQQFLTETVVLTASGGLLGVLFGLLCGPLFRGFRSSVTMMSPELLPPIIHTLEPRIAPWSIVLALIISLGVGIVFGVYPARQAAYMDPIEALRHE